MGKVQKSTREAKKTAVLTPKEKKAKKQDKKNGLNTIQPVIPR